MFAHAYFPSSFYAPGYFPPAAAAVSDVVMDGGRLRARRKHVRRLPEDIAREQRMVEQYLQTLERRELQAERLERVPARVRKVEAARIPAAPILTEAMARAASVEQLRRITEHAQSVERAREVARAERKRRRVLALVLLAIDD